MSLLRRFHKALTAYQRLISDCRDVPRKVCDMPAEISWRDGRGKITQARGRCLEISESGARIAYSEPIVLPAVMQFRMESDGRVLVRAGRVCRCTPNGSQFEIGLEFCNPAELRKAFKS